MGNFSRNTFHPEKNYVGVRLQQGVPLVDADWNELNDVARQDLYNGLSAGFADGVGRLGTSSTYTFWIFPNSLTNDFWVLRGTAIVGGRPVWTPSGWQRYLQQPWTDPAKAAADGVAVIPPLTTPGAARDDLVYLDVWEREVGQAEDGDIVNPVIGVETAVRLKRESCVRVAEGTAVLPDPPAGHQFMRLAVLHRPAAGAVITLAQAEDQRPKLNSGPAERVLSLTPSFQPVTLGGWTPWQLSLGTWTVSAFKPNGASVIGIIPVHLPMGAKLTSFNIQGTTTGTASSFFYAFVRSPHGNQGVELASESLSTIGSFSRTFNILPQGEDRHIVDTNSYHYYVYAWAGGANLAVEISGIRIRYEF